MPIYREEVNYDDSPWYKIMEDRAKVWEEFGNTNNLLSEGVFNAYHVIFKIKSRDKKLIINGKRSLTTAGNASFHEGVFRERLDIRIKFPLSEKRSFINIHKSGILNVFRRKHKNYTHYKKYFVTHNNENILLELKKIGLFDSEKEELLRLRINRKGAKLVLLELPPNITMIDSFLEFCDNLR